MKILESSAFGNLPIPESVAQCPICKAALILEGIEEWDADTGEVAESGFTVECTTEPDIDSDEWPEWHRGHYAHPYIDWLPLEPVIHRWLTRNYRVAVEANTP